jgi:hypothetical protein
VAKSDKNLSENSDVDFEELRRKPWISTMETEKSREFDFLTTRRAEGLSKEG